MSRNSAHWISISKRRPAGPHSPEHRFESGWGKTSPAYKRILEWCRRNKVRVFGLNAPLSVTRKIREKSKADIPPKPPRFRGFRIHPGDSENSKQRWSGHPGFGSVRRYYRRNAPGMQPWPRTILSWLRSHQGTLVILLGQIHADAQTGVPWYVARNSAVTQLIIYPKHY